jgi:hypothetical protein
VKTANPIVEQLSLLRRALPPEHAEKVLFCLDAMGARNQNYIEMSTGLGAHDVRRTLQYLRMLRLLEVVEGSGRSAGSWSIAALHREAIRRFVRGLGYEMREPPRPRRGTRIALMGRCR